MGATVAPAPPDESGARLLGHTDVAGPGGSNNPQTNNLIDDNNGKTKVNRRNWRCLTCTRSASLFWSEKLLLLLHYGQIFALLWAFARAWPLPAFFQDATRWTTWINVDIPSAYTWQIDMEVPEMRGSVYGEIDAYWVIAVIWAGLPIVGMLLYRLAMRLAWHRYWDTGKLHRVVVDVAVVLCMLLQLPAGLALARLYVCKQAATSNDYYLEVDPNMQCFTATHLIVAIICAPSTLFILLVFPVWMAWKIRRSLVYDRRFEHERYLRWKEAEYEHDLSIDWRREQLWTSSSFVRNGLHPYDRPLWMLSMTVLIVTFAYGRRNVAVMADIFFAVLVLWSLRQAVSPGYRCGTTNALAQVVYSGIALVAFWGVMRAHGLVNSLTVDSTWSRTMMVINALLATLVFGTFAAAFYPAFGWPKGYIGPQLWRNLLKEELESTKNDLQRMQMNGPSLPSTGGVLSGAITARDVRQHELRKLTARTTSFLSRNRGHHNNNDNTFNNIADGDVAIAMPSPADASGTPAAAAAIESRRASTVGDGTADLEALLAAREREYELRQVYGDAVAEQMMLSEHANNFRWEEQPAPLVAGRRRSTRSTEHEQRALHEHEQRASHEPGAKSRAVAARLAALDEENSDEEGSVSTIPIELRQLTAAEVSALEAVWIEMVKRAREYLSASKRLPAQLVNVPELRKQAKALKREFRRARICRHVLAWTLEEAVDDVAALADACERQTVFPNPELERLLGRLTARMKQRDVDYALATKQRKNVSMKLFALACWMNGRKIERQYIKGVNDHLFKKVAASYPANDELTMYSHIESIFRDVSAVEVSLMGMNDLTEVVNVVMPGRLRVDCKRCFPTGFAMDVDSTQQLNTCRGTKLHEETVEMLMAVYERLQELKQEESAYQNDDAFQALFARVCKWILMLLPAQALKYDVRMPVVRKKAPVPKLALRIPENSAENDEDEEAVHAYEPSPPAQHS